MRALDVTSSLLATLLRLGAGAKVGEPGPRPEVPLELYEFESCPYCRKVREALSILDLDAVIYPCPKGGSRFRKLVESRAGRAQFPYLVDPNRLDPNRVDRDRPVEMYESNDIVAYLFRHYGVGGPPLGFGLGPINTLSGSLASLVRAGAGTRHRSALQPEQRLTLYSFEASPFCRIVRERLCVLEIPYLLRNIARGSEKRPAFVERAGQMQVPFLVDPNTGTTLFESASIVAYLEETYGR